MWLSPPAVTQSYYYGIPCKEGEKRSSKEAKSGKGLVLLPCHQASSLIGPGKTLWKEEEDEEDTPYRRMNLLPLPACLGSRQDSEEEHCLLRLFSLLLFVPRESVIVTRCVACAAAEGREDVNQSTDDANLRQSGREEIEMKFGSMRASCKSTTTPISPLHQISPCCCSGKASV